MNNLTPFSGNSQHYFDNISTAKKEPTRSTLTFIRARIHASYSHYNANTSNFSNISALIWTSAEKAALIDCYSTRTNELGKLKVDIREHHRTSNAAIAARCPYCGINVGNTFDHYLSKSVFPEYAVCSLNLIPCCNECNLLKGGSIWNSSGVRQVLNLLYDPLPTTQFLIATPTVAPTSVKFSLSSNISLYGGLYQEITAHFDKLNLLQRFEEVSADEYSELKPLILSQGVSSAQSLAATRAKSLRAVLGHNNWKAVLYDSLANSPSFLRSL